MISANRTLLCFLIVLAACVLASCGSEPNGPDPDTTPPTVAATSPPAGAEQIALDVSVTATFSEELDPSSVTPTSFSMDNGVTGNVSIAGSTATFAPSSNLDSATTYTVTLTTAIRDVAGNPMGSAYSWSFKTVLDSSTADLVDPEAVVTNPAHNGVLGDTVTIQVAATDNTLIERVEFHIDGAHVPSADDTSAPYEYLWDLSLLEVGSQHSIQAVAYDTAGNSGSSSTVTVYYLWLGRPALDAPPFGAIVGSSVQMEVLSPTTVHSLELAEFYVNGTHIVEGDDTEPPFEFIWDASGQEFGDTLALFAILSDSASNQLSTDTVVVHYQWMLLIEDGNEEPQARDIRNVFARSTDTTLEFRVETNGSWDDYRDTSGIDLVFYLDTDRNRYTGRDSAGNNPINDIGAEYRIIIGLHGDSLAAWNETFSAWQPIHGVEEFVYQNIPNDTNVFEIGVHSSFVGDPLFNIDIVTANVQLVTPDPQDWRWDWAPNSGHATYNMSAPSYFGSPQRGGDARSVPKPITRLKNPFD